MPLGLGSSQPQLQQQRRAASSGASSSSVDVPHLVDVQDSLRLATLLRRFRSRGHLVAQLDPLRRTSAGPWLGPVGGTYTRCARRCCCSAADACCAHTAMLSWPHLAAVIAVASCSS